jgi:hypothetical protein
MPDTLIDVRTPECCPHLVADGQCGQESACDSWLTWAADHMKLDDETFLFCQENNPFKAKG